MATREELQLLEREGYRVGKASAEATNGLDVFMRTYGQDGDAMVAMFTGYFRALRDALEDLKGTSPTFISDIFKNLFGRELTPEKQLVVDRILANLNKVSSDGN